MNNDDSYWARVFRIEALQYKKVGETFLATHKRVRVDSHTIKLVRC